MHININVFFYEFMSGDIISAYVSIIQILKEVVVMSFLLLPPTKIIHYPIYADNFQTLWQ